MSNNDNKYMAFSGITTFWRSPHTQELNDVNIVVMGVPFDCGTSNRSGARLGPRAIREQSLHTSNFFYPWDFDIKEKINIIDYGDVGMSTIPNATHVMIESTYHHASKIYSSGAYLVTLGGDHTIPYGMVRAASKQFGKIALVHFDSHQDSRDGKNGKEISHASFAHDLAAEGTVDPHASTQVFIRTNMPNDMGYNILYAQDTYHMKPIEVAKEICKNAGTLPVYITFDIDSLDPAYAPGTGTPVPGGPSSVYIREVLYHLKELNIIGGDVVEVAPQYDNGQTTAIVASTIAGDIIQLIGRNILSHDRASC